MLRLRGLAVGPWTLQGQGAFTPRSAKPRGLPYLRRHAVVMPLSVLAGTVSPSHAAHMVPMGA